MHAHENPFRTEILESLPFLLPEEQPWESIFQRFLRLGRRFAVVGPHGSGKTHFTRHFSRLLADRGLVPVSLFRNLDTPFSASTFLREVLSIPCGAVVVYDGATHLPRPAWWLLRLLSHAWGGLVITAHVEGWLPTLIRLESSEILLENLLTHIPGWSLAEIPREHVLARFRARGGNMRETFGDLYLALAEHRAPLA